MKDEADNETLLIQYLLGNLPEEQRLQIEGEFLSDDQRYERLLALENELFYDYAQNRLPPGEREQFEKQFPNASIQSISLITRKKRMPKELC